MFHVVTRFLVDPDDSVPDSPRHLVGTWKAIGFLLVEVSQATYEQVLRAGEISDFSSTWIVISALQVKDVGGD
jgi:hypothetical protein